MFQNVPILEKSINNAVLPVPAAGPYVSHLSVQHFFDDTAMEFHSFTGWMVVVTNLVNSIAAAVVLMFVVRACPNDRLSPPHASRHSQ